MASTAEVLSYQELSRYNLTNLIKAQYEAGQPLDEKFIKNIDFTEKGDKTFWLNDKSGKQQRYDVKESLALNCVNYLPLVYYQEYITPEWINTEGQEYNMVNGALGAKKYDFLHYLRKVTSEYLETIYAQALGNGAKEEKEKIRAYLNVYENKFLNPILNIAHNVSNLGLVNANSDLYEKYYDLFKAVLPDLDRYMQYKEETFAYKKDQHKEINADNWVKNYAQIKWCGHKMGELKDLISELINNKKTYIIFCEVNKQESLANIENFKTAFTKGNDKVAIHMAKELNLSEAQKTSILNTIFKNWIEKEQRKFVSKSTSDPGTDDQYFEKILKIIDEILPNYKIDQNDNLSHLLTFKNKKFVNTVVEKYPELKTQPIYDGKTASELVFGYKHLENFMSNYGMSIANHKIAPTYGMYFARQLNKNLPNLPEINENQKKAMKMYVKDNYIEHVIIDPNPNGISASEKVIMYNAYILDQVLEKTDLKVKKNKI